MVAGAAGDGEGGGMRRRRSIGSRRVGLAGFRDPRDPPYNLGDVHGREARASTGLELLPHRRRRWLPRPAQQRLPGVRSAWRSRRDGERVARLLQLGYGLASGELFRSAQEVYGSGNRVQCESFRC